MGGLSLVSGPALDVVSLAEARKHCRIDVTDDDGLLAGYILAARRFAEIHTGRVMLEQTFELAIDDGWPALNVPPYCYGSPISAPPYYSSRNRITVPLAPLASVLSITYLDLDGNLQTLAADQYRVIRRSDRVRGWIEPAYGVAWPAVRAINETILVGFIAGYGSQPGTGSTPDLDLFRQAMLLLIGAWYGNREAVVVGQAPAELPLGVAALLQPLVIDGLI